MKLDNKQLKYLESSNYKEDIKNSVKKIRSRIRSSDNEDTIASIIEKEIYLFLESNIGIPDEQKKEFTAADFGFEFDGRIDMLDGGLLVEYKRPKVLKNKQKQEEAKSQVIGYYEQLKKAGLEINLIIVTDGLKISELIETFEGVKATPFKNFDEGVFRRIIEAIIFSESKRFDSRNIVSDFSLKEGKISQKIAKKLFSSLRNAGIGSKTDLILKEWQELFHLSEADTGKTADIRKRREALSDIFEYSVENSIDEYKCLFALQTVYAIIVKLIGCKILYKVITDKDFQYFSDLTEMTQSKLVDFLKKMEKGHLYSDRGITNLLEGDFFSWYVWENNFDFELYKYFVELITIVEDYSILSYENNLKSADIFKDLYIELMPKAVRHSLGEYFTPSWLADSLIIDAIEQIDNKDNYIAVDPTCGSGVFLVSLIQRILSKYDLTSLSSTDKTKLLGEILKRVRGVDINPLNVLTARVGYMIAISPLLQFENRFEIPVYLGDSAVTPEIVYFDKIKCYKYEVASLQGEISTVFPAEIVDNSEKFSKIINTLSKFTGTLDTETLLKYITQELTDSNDDLIKKMRKMLEQLKHMDDNGWEGLWVKIVGNFIKTATIKDVDIIVGNPPWVKWEFLPTRYAERIKAISVERHLFSGQSYMGAISLNICALIAHVTATSWLKPTGVLAFLMPKTILTQDSYEGFRKFIVDEKQDKRFYLQKAVDWEKAGHPFVDMQDSFLSYLYKLNYIDYSVGVPLTYVTKKRKIPTRKINFEHTFSSVRNNFDFASGSLVQLNSDRSGFTFMRDNENISQLSKIIGECEYKCRSGVEFTPREVYMLHGKKTAESNEQQFIFENDISKMADHKVNHIGDLVLETEFIKPLIKGPMIKKFEINWNKEYCIFPYQDGEVESVSMKNLLHSNEKLAEYLEKQKSVIEKQSERSKAIAKGTDFYSLSKLGVYTYAPYKVVFRDNSKWNAAVASSITTAWGEEMIPIPAKHAPYISQRKRVNNDQNELYISKDEAYYICGILNCPVVEEYMLSTYSSRSFSIDLKIKLPLFDSNNEKHQEICNLAKEIESNLALLDENLSKINTIYLELCDN